MISSRNITQSTINEGTMINTVTSTPGSPGNSASAVAMDLTLCDYAKLRKIRTGSQKVKGALTDKKLQVRITMFCSTAASHLYSHIQCSRARPMVH